MSSATDLMGTEDEDLGGFAPVFEPLSAPPAGLAAATSPTQPLTATTEPGIEISDGSRSSDIEGTDGPDTLDGNGGNDTIRGRDGDDMISGGTGADILRGVRGNDTLDGGSSADILEGGRGRDLLIGGGGNDNLTGGLGRDTLKGGDNRDTLSGGDGDDQLNGGTARDLLFGGDGSDTLRGGAGQDTLSGGLGRDFFVFTEGSRGRDFIQDFQQNIDVIDFRVGGLDFDDLKIIQSGIDVRIITDFHDIFVLRQDEGNFDEDDFIF